MVEHNFNFGDIKCSCGNPLEYVGMERAEYCNNRLGCFCPGISVVKDGKSIPEFVRKYTHIKLTGAKYIITIKDEMTC